MGSLPHDPAGYGTSLEDHFAGLGLHEPVDSAAAKQRAASFPSLTTTIARGYPPSTAIALPPPSSDHPYGLSRGPIGARSGHLRSNSSRPHSTDAYSSHSSGGRSWVLDSDASSICSMASSSQDHTSEGAAASGSGKARTGRSVVVYEDGTEEIFEEGGEVYRPESDRGDIDCEFFSATETCAASTLTDDWRGTQFWTSAQNRQKRRCKSTAAIHRKSCCA